ncbi:MAG: acyltransferase [Dehalococcoidia bacterium]|nr:acyltransferase [Dehalococcoidia bacterium]
MARRKARRKERKARSKDRPLVGPLLREAAGGPAPAPAGAPPAARYVPAIDGLRALAVTAVAAYHAGAAWAPGGFLGVEVFFVISGFLTTGMVMAARGQSGLGGFWARRARRLLPAAFALIAATLAWTALFESSELASLRGDALASLVMLTNWDLVLGHQSYFESFGRPSLLRHFWSLAVEWQYYLAWPALLWVALPRVPRKALTGIAIAGAAASAVLMAVLFVPGADPSRVYYGTDTRLAGLLVGSALALAWPNPGPRPRSHRTGLALDGAALALLIALTASAVFVGERDPALYRGGFAVIALATAALVAILLHPSGRWTARVLGCAPLRWLGLRSYSVYLWHWPVIMLTRPRADIDLAGLPLALLRIALTLALAEASYRWVETPFRRGLAGRLWRTARQGGPRASLRTAAVGFATAASVVVLVAVAIGAHPAAPPASLSKSHIRAVYAAEPSPSPTPEPTSTPPSPTPEPSPSATEATPEATVAAIPETPTPAPTPIPVATEPPTPPPPPPPTPTPTERPPRAPAPVSALGDSVMLGAAAALPGVLGTVEVDAAISRQTAQGIAVLREWEASGSLGPILVVQLGNNGTITAGQFDQVMAIAGSRRVVWVNVFVDRPWEAGNNEVIAAGVARYGNARLADWHSEAANGDGWFIADGIHLTWRGAEAYAAIIARAM